MMDQKICSKCKKEVDIVLTVYFLCPNCVKDKYPKVYSNYLKMIEKRKEKEEKEKERIAKMKPEELKLLKKQEEDNKKRIRNLLNEQKKQKLVETMSEKTAEEILEENRIRERRLPIREKGLEDFMNKGITSIKWKIKEI